MKKDITWDEVYHAWQYGGYSLSKELAGPESMEIVFVDYNRKGEYIYGYDWLDNGAAANRKNLIQKDPVEFLCFCKSTNKGTIHTAEMLLEAKDEEEIAAIWIAATAKELMEYSGMMRVAEEIHRAAWLFLNQRFYMWHHAMRGLVPEIMIPRSVIENISRDNLGAIICLIQMNSLMVKKTHTILCYSSLKDGKKPEYHSVRRD